MCVFSVLLAIPLTTCSWGHVGRGKATANVLPLVVNSKHFSHKRGIFRISSAKTPTRTTRCSAHFAADAEWTSSRPVGAGETCASLMGHPKPAPERSGSATSGAERLSAPSAQPPRRSDLLAADVATRSEARRPPRRAFGREVSGPQCGSRSERRYKGRIPAHALTAVSRGCSPRTARRAEG